jgi:hypothetical protein
VVVRTSTRHNRKKECITTPTLLCRRSKLWVRYSAPPCLACATFPAQLTVRT